MGQNSNPTPTALASCKISVAVVTNEADSTTSLPAIANVEAPTLRPSARSLEDNANLFYCYYHKAFYPYLWRLLSFSSIGQFQFSMAYIFTLVWVSDTLASIIFIQLVRSTVSYSLSQSISLPRY